MTTLHGNGYRLQPELRCCAHCLYAKPADIKWERLYCARTVNEASVNRTAICDRFQAE